MTTQFFIPMRPPTTTHNAKELHAYMKGGKPCAVLHDSSELKAARAKLHAYLAPHAPEKPIPAGRPVRLLVKWMFPAEGRPDGSWRTSKPDTDNAVLVQLDSAEYCALRKYYLDCLKWEQVAADMNFTSRGIFALRRRAIEHLKL